MLHRNIQSNENYAKTLIEVLNSIPEDESGLHKDLKFAIAKSSAMSALIDMRYDPTKKLSLMLVILSFISLAINIIANVFNISNYVFDIIRALFVLFILSSSILLFIYIKICDRVYDEVKPKMNEALECLEQLSKQNESEEE